MWSKTVVVVRVSNRSGSGWLLELLAELIICSNPNKLLQQMSDECNTEVNWCSQNL